jgi:hypothetical protein
MAGHIIASYKTTKAQSICSQNHEENPSEEKDRLLLGKYLKVPQVVKKLKRCVLLVCCY